MKVKIIGVVEIDAIEDIELIENGELLIDNIIDIEIMED
jgi:hypothetical protein